MQFDLNAYRIMDHLSSLSYKSSHIPDNASVSSTSEKNSNHILADPHLEISSDPYKQMLDHSVTELKNLLTEICKEGNTLLQNFQSTVPGSNLTRLESMIPRLSEASVKLKQSLAPEQYGGQNAYGKREVNDHNEDEELIEMEPPVRNSKKIKQSPNPNQAQSPDVILVGRAFSLGFILHSEIQALMPAEKRSRYADWPQDGTESAMVLKREDFIALQSQVTLRLSKEHAKITAKNTGNTTQFEITDLSVNGTYYFGNRLDGTFKNLPARLQKGIPFRLKNGDLICLLMRKGTEQPEMLLGFEFQDS